MNSWAQKPLYSYHTMTDVTTAEWRRKFLTSSYFYPVSPRFLILRISQVALSIQVVSTHSFPQICDPNRHLNNSTVYFFHMKLLPARFWNTGLKTTVKEKKIQCNLFVYPIDMTTYLLCLIDSRGKKKEVRRWDQKRGWSSVGQRRAESSPDPGNTSEILWNHRKGKRRD